MKTMHYFYILVLLAAVFFVEYDLSRRVEVTKASARPVNGVIAKNIPPANVPVAAPPAPPVNPDIFVQKFKKESLQLAKIQNNPELVQSRMKALADSMIPQDVQGLFEVISNDKNNGDQRALAVELLSLKNDTTSLMALQNFVANNVTVNGTKWDRKKELETILRAQAVESIAAYPQRDIALSTLGYLQQRVDEKFLNDRIGRATASLTENAPSLKQQDDDALKKLLE